MNFSQIAHFVSRGIRLFIIAVLLGTIGTISMQPTVAQAATFEVDTTSDNPALDACTSAANDCSLRGAINRANKNAGPDTITFSSSTNGIPFILTGAYNENDNASGDLDILDGGDLTIQGNGAEKTIIDGGSNDRIFHICPSGL